MDFLLHIIALMGMMLPAILGYNLIFGRGKILHFGPVGVSVMSAYAGVLALTATQSFVLGGISALASALIVSTFFAWLSLKLEPDGLGVMSIAVHLAILAVVLNWNGLTRGALGIPRVPRMPFLDSVADFALLSVMIAACVAAGMHHVDRSSFGRKLRALAEHDWHARSLGIDKAYVHFTAFLIAGVCSAVTNFLFPQYLVLLHPNDYQFPALVFTVMLVVAGGPGSVMGVTLSTILLVSLKEALRFVPLAPSVLGPVRLMLFGAILFVAVWWRRDTLFPKARSV